MAEWFKAAVLKTVERKFRGFESYSLRHVLRTDEFNLLKINFIYNLRKWRFKIFGEVADRKSVV